jgi:hypothetical protein
MATYSEKLKHPLWQKKRLEILERDKWTCLLCGDKETTLHVHHKKYKPNTDPWNYQDSNFVTLCEHCHYEVEDYKLDVDQLKICKISTWKDVNLRIMVVANPISCHIAIHETGHQSLSLEFNQNMVLNVLNTLHHSVKDLQDG